MIIDLTPYFELAIRAAPRPPLPPPMTRKSVSLEMGAILGRVVDRCRDMPERRVAAVLEDMIEALNRVGKACMGDNVLLEDDRSQACLRGRWGVALYLLQANLGGTGNGESRAYPLQLIRESFEEF
jgi:hypothetical protein